MCLLASARRARNYFGSNSQRSSSTCVCLRLPGARASLMTRLLPPLRIVLAILAEAARCLRAQPLTNAQGASEHLRTQVTAAELFYLRHLRTCAASASGSRSTCSATTPGLCASGLLLLLDCVSLVKVSQGGATRHAAGARVCNDHVREGVEEHDGDT